MDCARYLPNSVTITKILVRVVDSNIRDVIPPSTRVAEFMSDIYRPVFNFRIEMRLPFFNPTMMAVITLLTVDQRDEKGEASMVGHAFYPLFIDRITEEQPTDQSNRVSYFLLNFI